METFHVVSYDYGALSGKGQVNELSDLSEKYGGKYDFDMDAFYMDTKDGAQAMVNEIAKSILKHTAK